MTNEHIKEMLLELEKTDIDFTVTMTGKESKKVNGLYKPTTHEILIHNLNFKNDNQLMYTAIHEYTHHLINVRNEKNGINVMRGLEIEIQSSKEQVMSDSCGITNPFQSLKNVVAFSCRDWSANPEDAWIYGIIIGWGFDEDDEGKSCTDELERKFGSNKWTKSDTKRLKVLHNNWEKAKELMAKYDKENN